MYQVAQCYIKIWLCILMIGMSKLQIRPDAVKEFRKERDFWIKLRSQLIANQPNYIMSYDFASHERDYSSIIVGQNISGVFHIIDHQSVMSTKKFKKDRIEEFQSRLSQMREQYNITVEIPEVWQ